MTIRNEQQNLIEDLKAPIKSFRIFALEEVIKNGASQEVLVVLEELSRVEDDAECSMLLSHAINSVKSRLPGAGASHAAVLSEHADFMAAWGKADDNEKMRILSDLPARLPKGLRLLGPDLVAAENSPVISARVIRVFCRTWPDDKFALIAGHLNSPSLTLKLAALRTIVHMKPELLVNDLPALLGAKDPQIKALAIRGLVKIDKEEALNHLQALLLSPDLSDRHAGIQNCPFLPFEMVKPVLLKYFAAENHSDLLIRAGWILEMNPDVHVPFKLFEIAERSPVRKAGLIKGIVSDAVKLLEKSGILGGQFAAYTQKLQAWVAKRNALRFVRQMVARLDAEKVASELDQTVRNGLKQPVIAETLREALAWPVSERVKGRIKAYLAGPEVARASVPAGEKPGSGESRKPEKATAPVVSPIADFSNQNSEKKIEILAALNAESAAALLPALVTIFSNRDADSEVKIAAFHSFSRLRGRGLEDIAARLIGSQQVNLATAAVEYLGEVDPDRIFPYIGQCLKVADVQMKSVALGILKNYDFNQAVSSLSAMLRSSDPEQQKMAIQCMEQFDFALIREQLTDYLCRCDHESLVEAGLCYFAANPAPENAYSLFKIEKAHEGRIVEQVRQLREVCSSAGREETEAQAQPGAELVQTGEDSLQERWQAEQEKKRSRKPAYAYHSPAEEIKLTPAQTVEAFFNAIRSFVSARSSWVALLILIAAAGAFYVFFIPHGSEAGPKTGGAIIVDQLVREGTVRLVVNAAIEFESTQGEKFVLTPAREGYRMPAVGTRLRVSLVPFRKGPDNSYLARIRSLREIEAFSANPGETTP
ncbi:MAG TPA: HEAT repeat domain-containing protein [Candidatus Rifleibacterium sp.]|nr:HEAT repeat domain-containing protein [Candidatus Rifleibacterium sp.]HPT44785.1 HEAT repeat domain-containing protein [Candidatus Rifleibacterium sp.]